MIMDNLNEIGYEYILVINKKTPVNLIQTCLQVLLFIC